MKIIRGITLLIISIGLITGVMTIPGAAVTYNNVSSSDVTLITLDPTPPTVDQTLYGVTTSSTSVRTGAHVNYSVYATMPTGYKMNITGVAGTFYRVTYNDRTGYVSSSDVTLITLEPTPPTVDQTLYGVTTSSTSVRTGAHVNYSVYATMPTGYKMNITGVAGTFYRVTYNDRTGYVSSSDVTLITLEPTPPTVARTLYGVTTSSTSVRTGAHVNYSVYATMPTGYKMAITGVAGTFYRVTYNNKTGYVSSSTVILTAKPVVVTPVKVISVSLNKTTDTLIAGDTDNLTSTITPNNAVNKGVTWKSSDASIATVDNTGKITAVSAGTATITVTTIDGSKTATCIYKINNSIDNNTIITSKFTDPNFKTQVYSLIGKSSSDPILYSDVKNITTLSLNMLNISNLSGIEYFTGLITLGCFGNQLTTLDLSKNTALTYLNCSYNNLTSLYCNKKLVLSGYVSYRPQYTDLTHTRTVDNLVITIK